MSVLSRLSDAIEERTGLRSALAAVAGEELRGGARWGRVFGAAVLALILVEAVTGVALSTAYAPTTQSAWASVHYIQNTMPLGWLVRGVHHFGSHAIIALLGLHLGRAAIIGAYRRPREVSWWLGLALFFVVLGLAITGGRLAWDQPSYWALVVESNIVATMPVLGGPAQRLLQGGAQLGNLTLTRLNALHVTVLPLVLLGIGSCLLRLRRRHGYAEAIAPSSTVERRSKQLAYDGVGSLLAVIVVAYLAIRTHGAPLDAPADPLTDYPARPEWFLMPLYELRKIFSSKEIVATVVIPGALTALLVALPLLDRRRAPSGEEEPIRARVPVTLGLALGLAAALGLVWRARTTDARDEKLQRAITAANLRGAYANQIAANGVPPDGPLGMLARDPQIHGERLWKSECATCHTLYEKGDGKASPDRKGGSAPDLSAWGTAAWVEAVMRDPDSKLCFGGSPLKGEMPSSTKASKGQEDFSPMADADVKAIAAFVAGDPNTSPRGKELFADACNGCHALQGKGGEDSELAPDLTAWGTYGWLKNQIVDPANGVTYKPGVSALKGHMPTFGTSEIAGEVEVISRWVYWKAKGRWPTAEEEKVEAKVATTPKPASSAATPPTPAPTGSVTPVSLPAP